MTDRLPSVRFGPMYYSIGRDDRSTLNRWNYYWPRSLLRSWIKQPALCNDVLSEIYRNLYILHSVLFRHSEKSRKKLDGDEPGRAEEDIGTASRLYSPLHCISHHNFEVRVSRFSVIGIIIIAFVSPVLFIQQVWDDQQIEGLCFQYRFPATCFTQGIIFQRWIIKWLLPMTLLKLAITSPRQLRRFVHLPRMQTLHRLHHQSFTVSNWITMCRSWYY